jgi:cytochrome c oxidase subunit II
MPAPVRRKVIVLVLVFGAALALAAVALAGNGGFAPPEPHSPNAERISDSYNWIAIFAIAILVLVEGSLILFVIRYRRRGRPRTVEGPQIHGATKLELIWTAIPVLILVAIASFIFYKLPGIQNVPSAQAEGGPLEVKIDAHQFYWQFTYPDGTISIDELHAPVNRTVRVEITSDDVDHSWWVPELGGKFDAIPGETTSTWFKADRTGTYRGRCGEFCGVFHAEMSARVVVESKADYDAWIGERADATLGESLWLGACAKCHDLRGEGDYGPKISNNSILTQARALEELIRNGQNKMPPVARGWTDEQVRALHDYLRSTIFKEEANGG